MQLMKLEAVNGNGIDLAHFFSMTYCNVVNGLANKTIPDNMANIPNHLECFVAYGTDVYTIMMSTVTIIAIMCWFTVPGSIALRAEDGDVVWTYRT
jgi:hypothetical protein